MIITDTTFRAKAHILLEAWAESLEAQDAAMQFDIDLQDAALSITLEDSGQVWLLSQHNASRELWLSSPISGGLHFAYHAGEWTLRDGRTLGGMLAQELHQAAGVNFTLTTPQV